jgi:hypothetical protein
MRTLLVFAFLAFAQIMQQQVVNTPAASTGSPIAATAGACSAYTNTSTNSSITCTLTPTGGTVVIFGSQINTAMTTALVGCGTATTIRTINWDSTWYSEALYIAGATVGSPCVVTINFVNAGYPFLIAQDFANANATSPIDNTNCASTPYCNATGTGTPLTAASITTAGTNEMVVSMGIQVGGSSTLSQSGSGYTFAGNTASGGSGNGILYGLKSSAGSYSPTFAGASGLSGLNMAIALKK